MSEMRTGCDQLTRGRFALFAGIMLCLAAGLAACGAAPTSAASATGTPNCAQARSVRSVSGKISAVTASSFQVTDATSGQVLTVQLTSSTRISRIVVASASSLTSGVVVQVTADSSGTTAQRIIITPQGANGFGTRGGGARGTPPAGFPAGCVAARTPGQNPFGQNTARGGVRGTVESATSTYVVVTDARGQTLTFAITASTQILTTADGKPSDLTSGSTVLVTGAMSGTSLVARMVVVQPPASS